MREDPGYRGDNAVYLCRSLSYSYAAERQQHKPAADDSGLRCAERRRYTITFAEPWRSQVMTPSFKICQDAKRKSHTRAPRGLRSDTEQETEPETSDGGSTEAGCLNGL